jgi:hypothetical protein
MSPDLLPDLFEAQKKLAVVCAGVRRFVGGMRRSLPVSDKDPKDRQT